MIDETRNEVNNKLERWKNKLESKGFRSSASKIECLEYKFSYIERYTSGEVSIGNIVVPRVERHRYLGSVVHDKKISMRMFLIV